jgi:hypothetical protein
MFRSPALFFSPELLSPLSCFRDIRECNSDLKLQRVVHDVMHMENYEISAHLLRFFSRATSSPIVYKNHC